MYNHDGIVFDGKIECCFGNNFARNFVIFCVDNSLSSHSDNCKNNFLVLDERPADDKSNTKFRLC